MLIEVTGQQFAWNVRYPGPDGVLGRTDHAVGLAGEPDRPRGGRSRRPQDDVLLLNQLYLPQDRPVRVQIRSMDVIHSFFLPNFRVKQDAMPGMTIETWFVPKQAGDFDLACAEHCGLGHYRMRGQVHVVAAADFDQALDRRPRSRRHDRPPVQTAVTQETGMAHALRPTPPRLTPTRRRPSSGATSSARTTRSSASSTTSPRC